MKRTIMAAMVLSLAAGSLAFADPPHDHDRDHHEDRHQMDRHAMHDEHAHARFMMTGHYMRPHGYYRHTWHRGDHLPPAYRGSAYVIADPVVYRLRAPPAGYYWVRVDNNAVLAAVATGAVVDIAVNLFH